MKIMLEEKTIYSLIRNVSNGVKIYHQFCTMFGLAKIINCPTRITCSSSSLIYHLLDVVPSRIFQEGVLCWFIKPATQLFHQEN